MRALFAAALSLPLAIMLMGLLAALVPLPWSSWLVLQMLLAIVLWMVLISLVAIPRRAWPPLVGLLVANGASALLLQATSLYGGAA
ncbi:hypothetical protein A11A3_12143 [Alcanivorax hongdengensis A-11-3]|uniref:Uncharacterized protein n=1 Tax=Alcanivorax hongdengensis A-11-3 TaxID=1177179 RepID=L0WAB0_9GAMM|nr:hypothetical protein [Alcanivorax hongdengensis]EKF73713.1 hypothetical protein A11A3_12143 [Alcanivorax hongdengensis A-11-3]